MSNGLNLLHPRKDVAKIVIVFCVSPIVPEGLVFVGMKWASDWTKIEAEAAEQAAAEEKVAAAAAAAAMKWILSYQQGSYFGALCGDVSVRTQKLRKWSSFGHRFGHRSELPFTFGFLRCVHFVHDTSMAHNFWMLLEASFRADISLLDECLQIQKSGNMCMKSHRFLCNPYRSWEFHVSSTNVLV